MHTAIHVSIACACTLPYNTPKVVSTTKCPPTTPFICQTVADSSVEKFRTHLDIARPISLPLLLQRTSSSAATRHLWPRGGVSHARGGERCDLLYANPSPSSRLRLSDRRSQSPPVLALLDAQGIDIREQSSCPQFQPSALQNSSPSRVPVRLHFGGHFEPTTADLRARTSPLLRTAQSPHRPPLDTNPLHEASTHFFYYKMPIKREPCGVKPVHAPKDGCSAVRTISGDQTREVDHSIIQVLRHRRERERVDLSRQPAHLFDGYLPRDLSIVRAAVTRAKDTLSVVRIISEHHRQSRRSSSRRRQTSSFHRQLSILSLSFHEVKSLTPRSSDNSLTLANSAQKEVPFCGEAPRTTRATTMHPVMTTASTSVHHYTVALALMTDWKQSEPFSPVTKTTTCTYAMNLASGILYTLLAPLCSVWTRRLDFDSEICAARAARKCPDAARTLQPLRPYPPLCSPAPARTNLRPVWHPSRPTSSSVAHTSRRWEALCSARNAIGRLRDRPTPTQPRRVGEPVGGRPTPPDPPGPDESIDGKVDEVYSRNQLMEPSFLSSARQYSPLLQFAPPHSAPEEPEVRRLCALWSGLAHQYSSPHHLTLTPTSPPSPQHTPLKCSDAPEETALTLSPQTGAQFEIHESENPTDARRRNYSETDDSQRSQRTRPDRNGPACHDAAFSHLTGHR
ncbi:hypothetical protein BU16DRAFT_532486 [Lophium mytilinum]|uniref:Uncharacterized protein n=1 Tax=Lophium mytilinum TaxID=390894 RepID=A0A6A6RCI6_9PEZI|nr:hypothetical protein BU16DRAFT_532486 [Lophium mytilinum]